MYRTLGLPIFFSFICLMALSGCLAAAAGGATLGGVAVSQERSFGDAVDDVAIAATVRAKFIKKSVNDFTGIDIDVSTGRVLLTGTVRNPVTRIDAVRLAWQVNGVKEVINEIQVTDKASLRNFANDAFITAQARTKLIGAKDVRSLNYNIETVNGTLYLIGNTSSQRELELAAQAVSRVKGVKKVVSYVRIIGTEKEYNTIKN